MLGRLLIWTNRILLLPFAVAGWVFYLLPFWGFGYYRLAWVESSPLACVFIRNPRAGWWDRLWSRWGGNAWVPFAICVQDNSPRVITHELRHVAQWEALGLLFPVAYGLCWVVFGYENNPFEVDARAMSRLRVVTSHGSAI